MSMELTLGVPAHRGGIVVERPELSVGVVHAVSRPTGLELDLLARRPLDRRGAVERQADIRAGRAAPTVAPRRLLPPFDEGMELRVGWLDRDGRAHWEHGSWSASSGDHYAGSEGPSLRTVLRLPPMFDRVSVVLAWPEIGFPETVLELPLPDRATVARDTVSIWDAPLHTRPAPDTLNRRAAAGPVETVAVEAGRTVAAPRVLHRGDGAAVVLTRLSAVGRTLAMAVESVATGARAHAVEAAIGFPPAHDPGAAVAVVHGTDAVWLRMHEGTCAGGGDDFSSTVELAGPRPDGDVLTVLVSWPAAGLPDVCVDIPVEAS